MSENKEIMQFDSLLGGQENLPNEVHVFKFAAARCKEISLMTECILNPCSSKLVFQTLPVHMRRRIMSHNSKRLPRKLRAAYEAQLAKSGQPSKLKRPSRKYRRRPKNLLEEYSRRKRIHVWLETHIWHAKRFHMTQKWGYKLPLAPCDRAFRACYRATSKHCLLQDISYCPSFQITGSLSSLEEGFRKITNPSCGLSVTAKAYLSGRRAGQAYVFHINKYPTDCVGKIKFIWQPQNNASRTVWIFTHPSFYGECLNVITQCFDLSLLTSCSSDFDIPLKKIKLDESVLETVSDEKKFLTNKIYHNTEKNISLVELKDTFNYFRLTGPLSHAILCKALTTLSVETKECVSSGWFSKVCRDEINRVSHQTQIDFWEKIQPLKSPSELSANLVMGLNVRDPRINYPSRRTKAKSEDANRVSILNLTNPPENLCHSALWREDIRQQVSSNIITTHQLNKIRESDSLVPGEYCASLDKVPGVPVILIQRPGSQDSTKKLGYDGGWDIIMPSGYGMAFWLSIVLHGGRVGGLREASKIDFESGKCNFQPDTQASQNEEMEKCKQLLDKYFRLPPNKRVNFHKLSVNSPFLCRWSILCDDWSAGNTNERFVVCRDKSVLKSLQEMLVRKTYSASFDWNRKVLVPVKLLSKAKGKLCDFGLICLPKANIDNVKNKSSQMLEPLRKDENQKKRFLLRLQHKLELTKLRRRKIKLKRKLMEKSESFIDVPKQNNTELNYKYMSEMRELWLPSQVGTVRHQCSRETVGYVTHGDFSFTEAKGCGIGYVTIQGIRELVQTTEGKECLVLTRNTKSRQYRFATLCVITDS